jgi:uncharacterized membrane protein
VWRPGYLPIILAGLALATILLLWPAGALDKADHAAYAVCHRIAERSYIFGDRPLPLCARCSGTYLGAMAGFIVLALRGRDRAGALPTRPYFAISMAFLAAWAFDGANSYLTLFPGLPHLYEPHNLLRLSTGTLEGLVISWFLLPVVNVTFWSDKSRLGRTEDSAAEPGYVSGEMASLDNLRDLGWLLAGGAAVVAAVSSGWTALLYPLALISSGMVVFLLSLVNGMMSLGLMRRAGRANTWRELAGPLSIGFALAVVELTAIAAFRAELTAQLGWPF